MASIRAKHDSKHQDKWQFDTQSNQIIVKSDDIPHLSIIFELVICLQDEKLDKKNTMELSCGFASLSFKDLMQHKDHTKELILKGGRPLNPYDIRKEDINGDRSVFNFIKEVLWLA